MEESCYAGSQIFTGFPIKIMTLVKPVSDLYSAYLYSLLVSTAFINTLKLLALISKMIMPFSSHLVQTVQVLKSVPSQISLRHGYRSCRFSMPGLEFLVPGSSSRPGSIYSEKINYGSKGFDNSRFVAV